MKNRAALIIAIVLGLLAAFLFRAHMVRVKKEVHKGMELIKVVVVGKDVPKGAVLTEAVLRARGLPERYVHEKAVKGEEYELIVGQRTRYPIKEGEQVLWSDVGTERRMGLSSLITKGERTFTLAVDETTGAGGLLNPNDHVDILGTFTTPASRGKGRQLEVREVTITLLQNVTVLAVGQRLGSAGRVEYGGRFGGRGSYSSVTLAVTPEEAELLTFAREKGRLSLALRNPEDLSIVEEHPEIDFNSIIKQKGELTVERKKRIEIIKGTK